MLQRRRRRNDGRRRKRRRQEAADDRKNDRPEPEVPADGEPVGDAGQVEKDRLGPVEEDEERHVRWQEGAEGGGGDAAAGCNHVYVIFL
jgi:hypothetical protein